MNEQTTDLVERLENKTLYPSRFQGDEVEPDRDCQEAAALIYKQSEVIERLVGEFKDGRVQANQMIRTANGKMQAVVDAARAIDRHMANGWRLVEASKFAVYLRKALKDLDNE